MKPRSLIVNLYGDYVRYRGGEESIGSLTTLLAAFGVSEDSARVTLSRLRREGWLRSRRSGRRSWYSLTDRAWALLNESRDRVFQRTDHAWSGDWDMVIYSVPEVDRAARERLRKTLRWLGFGPLAHSTWLSAHDRFSDLHAVMSSADLKVHTDLLTCRTGSIERDRELANRGWDLSAIHDRYEEFIRNYQHLTADSNGSPWPHGRPERGERPNGDRAAFVQRVRLLHDYRKFAHIDPDLPAELLPPGWAGWRAHALFLQAYERMHAPAFRFFDTCHESSL